MTRRRFVSTAAAAVALAIAAPIAPARAQTAGGRTIRVIVPTGPGGTMDRMLRLVHQRAEQLLGQSIVQEYRPGAAGIPGIQTGMSAPADGQTVIAVYTALAFNPWSFERLPYDTFNDLLPVSQLVNIPLVLAAGPGVPAANVAELVAWAKANPGKLTIAAGGLGGGSHLGGLLLGMQGGFDITVVPYKGGAAALPDLLEGRIGLMLDSWETLRPHAEAGRLRLLGVATERRQEFAPSLPAIAETIPGFAVASWQGVTVRAGTPEAERKRLAAAYAEAVRDPSVRRALIAQGLEPVGSSPDAFAATIRSDHEKWGPVIRKAGLKN